MTLTGELYTIRHSTQVGYDLTRKY